MRNVTFKSTLCQLFIIRREPEIKHMVKNFNRWNFHSKKSKYIATLIFWYKKMEINEKVYFLINCELYNYLIGD